MNKKLLTQILKFGGVGILATALDFGLLWFFRDVLFMPLLLANGLSFTNSLLFNYAMSMKYVFTPDERLNKDQQFWIFVISSLVGLGLNELIMYLGVLWVGETYKMIIKLGATGVVMVYNFISKKLLLEPHKKRKEEEKNEKDNSQEIR